MRIDKFLKVSRVIKRRTVAQEACDGGRIEINGKVVKPSKDVNVGDIVTVAFGNRTMQFEVLSTDERQTKQSAETMYRIIASDASRCKA
ncbi:MAG: RNA-binding S4 domain-containing protein [Clostridia bacterium]|nr:RNA-binding S4 domain-containing protein [Clostridia bacterium]